MSKKLRTRRPLVSKGGQTSAKTDPGNNQEGADIFKDRREESDRRGQSLPIPSRMCRRREERRKNSFNARPWWLQVNYNDDHKSWI